jgi:glycerol-3-phosphate dehydrogenase
VADAVIIGAGIQGCSMALAAAERGARPILVEREGIGSGASGNSYGIVHGGLRYLQSLSLDRWRRSRLAQNWYLQRFADLVGPLRCVMPLYQGQFRSPTTFAVARSVEAALSRLLLVPQLLPAGGFSSRKDVLEGYPVPQRGLVGAAYWYDAELLDPSALLHVMLDKARARGVTVLGHHEVERLMTHNCQIRGVMVRDRRSRRLLALATDTVVDCGGASAGACMGIPVPHSAAVLAFNLLLDLPPPPPGVAFAVSPEPGRGRSYFLRNQDGMTLAGSFYRAAPGSTEPNVENADIEAALAIIRRCVPDLPVGRGQVCAVTAGLLPDRDGTGRNLLAGDRHLMPIGKGYHMLVSTKLTTAPLLSERLATRLWPRRTRFVAGAATLQHA